MKRVAILGATGSIGRQTLDVVANCGLRAVALACHSHADTMLALGREYGVNTLACIAPKNSEGLTYWGPKAYVDLAEQAEYDILVVACASIAGLAPTLAALRRGKRVALANKETLVVGAHLVDEVLRHGGELLPVDSEHCAIHQCMPADRSHVAQLILTASGGALRDMPLDKLADATPSMVLAHPNWRMGDKITVDCATMVNKGLEVLEAMALFAMPLDKVQAVLHRESVVHSVVHYVDNSYLAQMAVGDMRLAIQYALMYPARVPSTVPPLDWRMTMTFDAIDPCRYPAYGLVRSVAQDMAGRVALVAADDVAVDAFLRGNIPFRRIHTILEQTVSRFAGRVDSIEAVERLYDEATLVAKEGL